MLQKRTTEIQETDLFSNSQDVKENKDLDYSNLTKKTILNEFDHDIDLTADDPILQKAV